eukprot:scaffold3.g6599.t1
MRSAQKHGEYGELKSARSSAFPHMLNLAARIHLFEGLGKPQLIAHVCNSAIASLQQGLPAPGRAAQLVSLRSWASSRGLKAHASSGDTDGAGGARAVAPTEAGAAVPTTAVGQVMSAQANFVRVKIDRLEAAGEGPAPAEPPRRRLLCVVRGLLKKIKHTVVVGDFVRVVGIDWADGRGMVEEVLPRSSQLDEPAVANVTHVLLVFAADMPPFQPSPATRFLLSAEAAGLPVALVLNKTDLVEEARVQELVAQVSAWGYSVLPVSVRTGRGLDELTLALRGQVSVVAGPSGAGKSSIINALRLRALGLEGTLNEMAAQPSGSRDAGDEEAEAHVGGSDERDASSCDERGNGSGAQHEAAGMGSEQRRPPPQVPPAAGTEPDLELQAVGQVSLRIGRGKHTTRNVSLLEMGSGGLLVDTPGFNQPSVLSIPPGELGHCFPEVQRRLEEQRCAFRSCQHLQEPGCAVRGDWERYPLYCEIHGELKAVEAEAAARSASKKKREGTVRYKSRAGGQQARLGGGRRWGGRRGMEARLESKSYRRESRRVVKQKLTELQRDVEEESAL